MDDQSRPAEEIRTAQQHLQQQLGEVPQQIYLLNSDGRCLFVNARAQFAAGATLGRLLGRTIFEVFPALANSSWQEEFQKIARERPKEHSSFDFTAGNGRLRCRTHLVARGIGLIVSEAAVANATASQNDLEDLLSETASLRCLSALGEQIAAGAVAVDVLLGEALDTGIAITETGMGTLQALDPDSGRLRTRCQRGFEQEFCKYFDDLDGSGFVPCSAAIESRGRIVIDDVTSSDIFRDTPSLDVAVCASVRSVQSTPLPGSSGRIYGVISTLSSQRMRLRQCQLRSLDLLARQTGELLEEHRAAQPPTTQETTSQRLEKLRQTSRNTLQQSYEATTRFVFTDLNLALTFLDHAGITRKAETAATCRQLARRAYLLAVDFSARLPHDGPAQQQLLALLQRVRERLTQSP